MEFAQYPDPAQAGRGPRCGGHVSLFYAPLRRLVRIGALCRGGGDGLVCRLSCPRLGAGNQTGRHARPDCRQSDGGDRADGDRGLFQLVALAGAARHADPVSRGLCLGPA